MAGRPFQKKNDSSDAFTPERRMEPATPASDMMLALLMFGVFLICVSLVVKLLFLG
jgi:hypothetical protein